MLAKIFSWLWMDRGLKLVVSIPFKCSKWSTFSSVRHIFPCAISIQVDGKELVAPLCSSECATLLTAMYYSDLGAWSASLPWFYETFLAKPNLASDLVPGNPAHGRGAGTRWSWRSFPLQAIPWFTTDQIPNADSLEAEHSSHSRGLILASSWSKLPLSSHLTFPFPLL